MLQVRGNYEFKFVIIVMMPNYLMNQFILSGLFSCLDYPSQLIYMLMSLETDVYCGAQMPDFQDAHLKAGRGEK